MPGPQTQHKGTLYFLFFYTSVYAGCRVTSPPTAYTPFTMLSALAAGRPTHHRCISGRMDMDYGTRFAPAAAQPDRGDSEPACVIRETGAKGMGVFAAEDIERGRWVCQYIGTVVSDSDESDASREPAWDPLALMPTPESTSGLPRVDPGSDYVLALCPGLCLDARHSNHFSRYINHDEHGNLQCSVSVDERRADFFAAAPIRRGSWSNTHTRAPCTSSRRAWRLWRVARCSALPGGATGPVGAQPRPPLLGLAAFKVAASTVFYRPGVGTS